MQRRRFLAALGVGAWTGAGLALVVMAAVWTRASRQPDPRSGGDQKRRTGSAVRPWH